MSSDPCCAASLAHKVDLAAQHHTSPKIEKAAPAGGILRNMRSVPVSTRLLITVMIAALLPMAPLFLFKYPIAELVQRLVAKLAGL